MGRTSAKRGTLSRIRGADRLGPVAVDVELPFGIGLDDHDGGRLPVAVARVDRDRAGPALATADGVERLGELFRVGAAGRFDAIGEELERVVRVGAPGAGVFVE